MTPVPKISIIFGDLSVDQCWLSSSGPSLSLLGFLNAGYRTRSSCLYIGDHSTRYNGFEPLHRYATMETDLFLWGCVVYELMTGHCPGDGQGLESRRKCWADEITSAVKLVFAVRRGLTEMGVVLREDDKVPDVSLDGLRIQPDADTHI